MRKYITSLLLLCAPSILCAQTTAPNPLCEGRENSTSRLVPFASQQEAATGFESGSKYVFTPSEWERNGSSYTANFTVPFAWLNRETFVRMRPETTPYAIEVNGQKVGHTQTLLLPFDFDISKYIVEGRNRLRVTFADKASASTNAASVRNERPSLGAYVFSQPRMRIREIEASTSVINDQNAGLQIGVIIKTHTLNPRQTTIYYELRDPQGEVISEGKKSITLDMRGEDTVRFFAKVPRPQLWTSATPTEYTLTVRNFFEGRDAELVSMPVGLIEVTQDNGKILINGKAESFKYTEVEPDISKDELLRLKADGYNLIRPKARGFYTELYELCNSIGIYVIAQVPINTSAQGSSRKVGGNTSNNPQWHDAFIDATEQTYNATKHYPCVVAYSIAENSANGINLYESFLRLKSLEKSRPVIYPDATGEWNSDPIFW